MGESTIVLACSAKTGIGYQQRERNEASLVCVNGGCNHCRGSRDVDRCSSYGSRYGLPQSVVVVVVVWFSPVHTKTVPVSSQYTHITTYRKSIQTKQTCECPIAQTEKPVHTTVIYLVINLGSLQACDESTVTRRRQGTRHTRLQRR